MTADTLMQAVKTSVFFIPMFSHVRDLHRRKSQTGQVALRTQGSHGAELMPPSTQQKNTQLMNTSSGLRHRVPVGPVLLRLSFQARPTPVGQGSSLLVHQFSFPHFPSYSPAISLPNTLYSPTATCPGMTFCLLIYSKTLAFFH